ncbi:unnamed protein product [Phytomonas sp. Hart1]|nr:unnamed protein product [Phytomonas sp. Hart1]|eukprot:CCW71870.1 unnamed protein product [Phytomonas sp. isolate Hart1]
MSDADWKAIAEHADAVLASPSIGGCHEILTNAYENGVRHPEILWRLGRSYYEMAEESSDKKLSVSYKEKGLALCQQSLQENPNNFAAHKWLGILLSAQDVGNKKRIENAYIIRDHFLKALELNPKDANSLHCMGKWCWSVLKISWVEQKAAKLLFGEPPKSTVEDCLKYLLASAEAGNTIHNSVLIGDVYYYDKKKEKAKLWYQKAIEMPVNNMLQKKYYEAAEAKLTKC